MATPVVTQQLTWQDKIMQASVEAAKIAEIFAPAATQAIEAGVAVEPIILSFASLIAGLFKHHTKT